MTFEEVDVDAVADLSPEDVEAREVFGENKVEGVNNPFLDFLLSGGDPSGSSVGGRRRNARIQSGETSRSDGELRQSYYYSSCVYCWLPSRPGGY